MENISTLRHTNVMAKIVNLLLPADSRPPAVGRRVTALRMALKLKPAEFADSIQVDRSSLTKIEKGTAGLSLRSGMFLRQLYGVGLNFIYMGDLSDLPFDLRGPVMQNLLNPSTTE